MENKDTLLKKILDGKLTAEEERTLLNSTSSIERQKKEWKMAADLDYANDIDGRKNLKSIQSVIFGKRNALPRYLKIYAVAASFLVCLFLSSTLWFYQKASSVPMVEESTFIVTNGRQNIETIQLSDGTCVMLGAGSKLTYPKEFNGDRRQVELLGQAFFEVAKNPQKPFIVKTSQMDVTAVGTAFEVFCFGEGSKAETILLNGKVMVDIPSTSQKVGKEILLSPDQKITVDENGATNVEKVDANTYSSWRSKGGLSFVNEKLSMIIPRLEKWYGAEIVCDEKIADKYRFSFTIDRESFADVMTIIDRISSLSVRKQGNTYVIAKQTN